MMASAQADKSQAGSSEANEVHAAPNQPEVTAATKVKHDWYQTESTVVLSIMIKNVKAEDLRIMYGQQTVSITVRFPDSSDLILGFNLAHQIVPSKSSHKIFSSKIELKLPKLENIRWDKLESEPHQNIASSDKEGVSKAHEKKDWDKVVVELTNTEDEKPQGEAALNALFQQIYGDGSDEVRRAMNKSFVESGGTVLSTVWKDVGKSKVDVKPPEGMEWRKWD